MANLPIKLGGTGTSTLLAGQIVVVSEDGISLETVVTPGTGKVLTSNGSNLPTWETPISGGTGTVTSVALSLPSGVFDVTGSPITTTGTLTGSFKTQTANQIFASPDGTTGTPVFRSLTSNDIPSLSFTKITGTVPVTQGGTNLTSLGSPLQSIRVNSAGTALEYFTSSAGSSGTVTSVGLSLPSIFSVTGSPVSTSGTLTGSLTSQLANTIFAGPGSGSSTTPTFRSLVPLDLGTGTANSSTFLAGDLTWKILSSSGVTSVGLSAPSVFSVGSSPITTSGTLALTFATGQTPNQVLASPDGTAGAVSLRSLVAGDIPSLDGGIITSGTVPGSFIGSGSTNYIQNQTASDQSASLRISGTARVLGFVNLGSTSVPTSPLTVTYSSGNQLKLVNGAGNEQTDVSSAGVVSRTATGTTPQFLFLNPTEITGSITASSTTTAQQFLRYDATHYESVTVASSGSITRDLVGASPTFTFGKGVSITGTLNTTGKITSTLTTEQLRTAYDGSNYMNVVVASNGSTTFDLTGTSPLFTFSKATSFTAGIAANNTAFNLSLVSVGGGIGVTTTQYLFGGATTINYRVGVRGSSANTLAAGSSGASFIVGDNAMTTASSGTHAILANSVIKAFTITSGGASTVTNASSLYIDAAPTGGTSNWASYIAAGNAYFGGQIKIAGGTPGSNKILTSDSTGLATWQTPTTPTTFGIRSTSTNDTLTLSDYGLIVDTTAGAVNVGLPTAASSTGKQYWIMNIGSNGANSLTIDPNGSELINGSATYATNLQYKSVVIISTGTVWYIMSSNV